MTVVCDAVELKVIVIVKCFELLELLTASA